jgi:uncharacterized MAPEG superfamily protein
MTGNKQRLDRVECGAVDNCRNLVFNDLGGDPPWADRARRAHLNAIENLAVFAPLVLVAAIVEVSTKATVLSAQIYVAARLAHYVIYTAGIPVVRTIAFLVGAIATVAIAGVLILSAA